MAPLHPDAPRSFGAAPQSAACLAVLLAAWIAGCDAQDGDPGSGGAGGSTTASGPGGAPSTSVGSSASSSTVAGSGAGSSTTSGSGASSSSGQPECSSAGDCPGQDEPCRQRACDGGVCSMVASPAGALVADPPGDCRRRECDGVGAEVTVADDADLPNDGRECTEDTCAAGLPASTPKVPGSVCSEGGGRFCSAAGTCQHCPPVGVECIDPGPGESNDAQAAAHSFGEIGDDDDEGLRVCGTLTPGDSVDWFTYVGRDGFLAEVGPGRVVAPQDDTSPGGLTVCKYVQCLEGPTVFSCPGGTTADVAEGGQAGCCAPSEVDISDDFLDDLCSSTGDDDAQVWIKVERVGEPACAPYDLQFHY